MEDVYGLQQSMKSNIRFISKMETTTEQSGLRDLLTDLRHVAAEMGLDFDFAVEGSAEVFDVELNAEYLENAK